MNTDTTFQYDEITHFGLTDLYGVANAYIWTQNDRYGDLAHKLRVKGIVYAFARHTPSGGETIVVQHKIKTLRGWKTLLGDFIRRTMCNGWGVEIEEIERNLANGMIINGSGAYFTG